MRIRSRLLVLVCALLLPALVGAAIALAYIFREEQNFRRQSMQETVRALALALDRDMARRAAMLETLAASPSLQRGELDRFYRFASTVARQSDAAIILSDLQGRQLVNTRLPMGKPLPPMLPAERESRARWGNDVTIISDLYLPPAGLGPHSFALQVPVRRDGVVVQFLTMASFASQMQNLFAEQQLPAGWHATVIDRSGIVVARSVDAPRFVGKPVRDDLAAKIRAEPEGSHEGVNLAGVTSVAFFSRAAASGWVFLVAVPKEVLNAPATRGTLLLAAISLLLLGLGVAGAFVVARRVSRPVESLREAAEQLGRGEAVSPPRTGTIELDAVGAAMAGASVRLRDATAELERRVSEALESFERSQRALVQAQKLEALGRLTGGIAHDFNNVLQTVTASLQVLQMQARPGDAVHQDLLSRCQRAVTRGSELARQLMAFGRAQDVRAETLLLPARLAEARHLFEGALPANVLLSYELPADLWPVTVDPAQLELALLNLVINARDAMPAGGGIALRGSNQAVGAGRGDLRPGEYVVLAVTDRGAGMTDEVMARAFDPFFTTKEVGKGSGMGLPQAYAFARQHGGTLTLESRPGEGTTATIYLPRAQASLTPSAPAAAAGTPLRSRGKVLLVEDDEHVRETVSIALMAAGFAIQTAATGDEALRRIEGGERFDALFTDVVMPGSISGVDLAVRVRERHPGVGVVIATGYSERAVQIPGVRALAKPYELGQAIEAINAAIRAPSS